MKYSIQEALRELKEDQNTSAGNVGGSRIKYNEGDHYEYEILKFDNLRIFGNTWCKVYNDRTIEFLKDLANNIPSDLTILVKGQHHNFGCGKGDNNEIFIVVVSKNLYSEDKLNSEDTPASLIAFSGRSDWFKPSSNVVRDVFMVNENNLNDIQIIKTTNMQRYFDPLHYHAYAKYYPEIFELKISSAKDLANFIDLERQKDYYNKYKLGKENDYYEPGRNGDLVFDVKMNM